MPNSKRPRGDRRASWWTLTRRRWLYGVCLAAMPVALAYGLVSPDKVAPLVGLAAAVLSMGGMALKNPTQD